MKAPIEVFSFQKSVDLGVCPLLALCLVALVAACGAPQVASGVYDPYETANRKVHADNRSLDRALVAPASQAYGRGVPEPVRLGVSNLAGNVDLPRVIVNDVLQFNIGDAGHNFFRLLVNTTLGVGGIFDPARSMGLTERDSDFGETLYVWGVAEGAYMELPLFGPSTQRDAAGRVVDFGLNPLRYVLDPTASRAASAASVASTIGDRYRYSDTVDSILYDSADSYAQARLLYLESRRFELSGGTEQDPDYYDPYEDLYGE